ncbi:hypothetical protein [Saccharibacillus kuerlensis]|uniref:Uncharacterized protein n=1 Tax=Saccharibacillus kuerlensis TaxID=459527 RepID=A0ABQ2L327_9BACL|nr:hypothetical protein [Saccharibacillus kuerlensis]GGO00903.1 hypothetical protein GCM10010969_22630 [Saccharibacillus kuerlensis]
MNLNDEQVEHASFGTGKVIGSGDGRINVRFTEEVGEKSFLYPEAFDQHLKMSDPQKQEQMGEEVRQKKILMAEEKRAEEQKREEEEVRLAEEKAAARKPARRKSTTTKKKA